MLSRRFIPFLLFIIKMAVSQTVYPTTAVTYSTNSVPTVQNYPATSTVTAVPATVTATTAPTIATATAMPTAITTCSISATPATSSSLASSVTLASMPTSTVKAITCPASQPITVSPMSKPCADTEPKAYFLPANIPDPKVTILPTELPSFAEVKTILLDEPDFKSACPLKLKDNGPLTAVKRVTMACTDEVPFLSNQDTVCPGITKIDPPPTPVIKKKGLKSNPIDFEGLYDSFMTCL